MTLDDLPRDGLTLAYFQDSGHGWIQAPVDFVELFGLKPTRYSYTDGFNIFLEEGADGWTGYTHQWREPWAQPMRELCMSSVETLEDQDLARAMGWRTYRIRRQDEPLARNEIACPSDTTGRQCIACKACDGALKPSAASVAIIVHGPKAKAWT